MGFRDSGHFAGKIVSCRPNTEASGSEVPLGLHLDEAGQPGRRSQQEDQEPGGKRIEGPGVTDGSDTKPAAHHLYYVVRGHAGRLVYQHRTDQS